MVSSSRFHFTDTSQRGKGNRQVIKTASISLGYEEILPQREYGSKRRLKYHPKV
jgi:hypothetical protein